MKCFKIMYALIVFSPQKILKHIKFIILVTHTAEWEKPSEETWAAESGP